MGTQAIDYGALAAQAGAIHSAAPASPPPPQGGVDYGALASQAGAIHSTAASTPPPAAPATPEPAASSWERLRSLGLKGWINENLAYNEQHADDHGAVLGALNRQGIGWAKGLIGAAGFGAHVLATIGDQPSAQDAQAYQQEHPGASMDETLQALNGGKDENGNPIQAYRAPQNRQAQQQRQESAAWFKQASKENGFWEGLGGAGEQLVELLGTDGLSELSALREAQAAGDTAKAVSMSDKLKQIQGVASFLEKNEKIAKLVDIGMRTLHAGAKAGAVSAAQTYVHSQGDAGEAATAGALGAVGGAGLHGIVEGGSAAAAALISHLSPEMREIAGQWTPFLRSQITRVGEDGKSPVRPSFLQRAAATPEDSEAVRDAQQLGATRTIEQEAQGVAQRELQSAQDLRNSSGVDSTADNPSAVGPGAPSQGRPVDEYVRPRPGVPVEDTGNAGLTSGAPQLTSGTPELGTGESADLARTDMLGAREDPEAGAQGALPGAVAADPSPGSVEDTSAPELGAGQPNAGALGAGKFELEPIDVQKAMGQVRDFRDLHDTLFQHGLPVYDRLNEVTGGNWQAADKQIRELQMKAFAAVGPKRAALEAQLSHARGQMDKLFDHPDTGISKATLTSAKNLLHAGYIADRIHNAIEPAYQISRETADALGEYRGFNGTTALKRFKGQMNRDPEAKALLGPRARTNMESIFKYNSSKQGQRNFGDAVTKTAKWLVERVPATALAGVGYHLSGFGGAAALGVGGETAYGMTKLALHQIATNPEVGRNLLYALDSGARPENFTPHIGAQILRGLGVAGVRAGRYGIPLAAGQAAQTLGGN